MVVGEANRGRPNRARIFPYMGTRVFEARGRTTTTVTTSVEPTRDYQRAARSRVAVAPRRGALGRVTAATEKHGNPRASPGEATGSESETDNGENRRDSIEIKNSRRCANQSDQKEKCIRPETERANVERRTSGIKRERKKKGEGKP